MAIPDNKDPQTQVTDQPYPFVEIQMESVGISAADIQAIKDIQPVSPTDSPTFTGLTLTGDLLAEGYATFNTGMDTLGDIYFAADGKKIIHQGLIIKGGSTQSTHIDCDGGRAFSATATYTDILFGLTKIRVNVAGGVTVTGVLNATSAVLVTPTLTSPVLGVATATSVNKVAITAPATSATLTIADGKTMTASNTLTLSGTDGTALNINAVATLNSGTYTPTLTAIVNVSGSTAYPMQYMRVGNTVTVSGRVDITATGAGVIDLSVSLPIASTLAASYQVAGYGANLSLSTNPATVLGYLATNRALMEGVASGATTYIYFITFTYLVA